MVTTNLEQRPGPSPAESQVWGGAYRRLTAGLLLIITGAAYEALAVATIMPATAAELGGLALYGWSFAAFMLANLFGVVVAGWAIDRYGAARPFVAGSGLFVVGLLIAGLAPSMEALIGARAVQGLGAGFISSIAFAVIGRGYPEALRPRMLALSSSAWVIPGLLGPALAGLIGDGLGWRWVFLSVVPLPPIAVLCALPALRALGPTGAPAPAGGRIMAAGLLTLGAGALTAGLGAGTPLVGVPLAAAGAAVALPALRRLMPAGTLRAAPGLPAAVALMGLLNMAFFGVDAFVPLALSAVRGQSAAFTGLALTAGTIAWTAGSWLQAAWVRRVRRELVAGAGMGLLALGSAGIIAVVFPTAPLLLGLAAWAVAGLGIGLAYSTFSLVVLDEAPPGQQGASTAALQLSAMLGTALGTGIGGVIVAAAPAPGPGIQLHTAAMVGVALLGALLAPRLGRGARGDG
ncbi:MAG: MFS transporter [Chloroflexales bacterium]|nr:MFS transporter [Chloroflexales bacterium]